MTGYAICTAPRSGSNFLCQLLAGTGVLGRPLEYFNGPGRRYFDDPCYPDEPSAQAKQVVTMGATPNGVYGLKLFAHQHDWIVEKIRWTEHLPGLRFVFLTRRDLLAQGISWARARQTGQFRHTQATTGAAIFDAASISECLATIVTEYARWQMFFARNGIEPVRLVYEDIVAKPQMAVDSVAGLFGLAGSAVADVASVDVRTQRDGLTEAWRQRFIAECGDCDFIDRLQGPAPELP